nr:1,3-beta-glucanosyltransferase gel1 [Quercus suber]
MPTLGQLGISCASIRSMKSLNHLLCAIPFNLYIDSSNFCIHFIASISFPSIARALSDLKKRIWRNCHSFQRFDHPSSLSLSYIEVKMRVHSLVVLAASYTVGAMGAAMRRQSGSLPTVRCTWAKITALFSRLTHTLKIESRGNAFWDGDERFYIRGVAYQPGGAADAADPLLDLDTLRQDVEQFQKLGINTIRIYTIDNSENHDEAMAMLDEAGIYLALDANTPKYSLNRENIDSLHASYNDVYLQSVFATIDAFKGYTPYIKAVTRDMRQYIAAQADRPIPVGYSSADVAENIEAQALYFACGDDEMARSDFFAFNDYSWCSPSSFQQSGWDRKVQTYSNYSLPIFLSEFGCITNTRDWSEVAALYSEDMTSVYSGGLAYEYTLEANGYGLVEADGNGNIVPNEDFERLEKAYAATSNPSGDGGARTETTVPDCPAESADWQVSTLNLPEMPSDAKAYIKSGAGTGPGLAGEGSQWAGTPSDTDADLSNGVTVSEDVSSNSTRSSTTNASDDSDSDSPDTGAAVGAPGASIAVSFAGVVFAVVASAMIS